MKRCFYQVPAHVSYAEAAELYRYMATGETAKTEFLDKRNQLIFDVLEHLIKQVGRVGTEQFCQYLTEHDLLNAAGGLPYVQKIFNYLEPLEAVC
jgi:replicative DNA helicase